MSTDDLFHYSRKAQIKKEQPLAARMRPRTLQEFVGQESIVGPGTLLRRAIDADRTRKGRRVPFGHLHCRVVENIGEIVHVPGSRERIGIGSQNEN